MTFRGEERGGGGLLIYFCDICAYANVYISILGGLEDVGVGGMLLALRVSSEGRGCLLHKQARTYGYWCIEC